jgi:hypothetical protein
MAVNMAEVIEMAVEGWEMVDLSTLKPYPNNPNNGDLEAIEESLRRFGMVDGLIVNRPTREILGGNHRYFTLLEAGVKQCWVGWVTKDEQEAQALVIGLNEIGKMAWWDKGHMSEILKGLDDLSGTGYTFDKLDDLLASLGKIEETPYGEFKGDYAETPAETAARGEGITNTIERQGLKETVVVHSNEEYGRLVDYIKRIRQYTECETTSQAVLEACRVYAGILEQG